MHAALAPLLFWHGLVVAYAVLLGVEAPVLLFAALYKSRTWREILLAGIPAAAFGWALWLARGIDGTYEYWKAYWQFELEKYPANFPQQFFFDGVHRAVAGAAGTGWTVGIVTTVVLIAGWGVALRWLNPGTAKPDDAVAPTAAADDVESGELEITLEPIPPTGGTTSAG